MEILKCFLIMIALLANISLQRTNEIDQAHVEEILVEMTLLIRQQNNITRAFMDPSTDVIQTTLVDNDLLLTVPQATRLLNNLKAEMGIADESPARREDELSRRLFAEYADWTFPIPYAFDGTHSDAEKNIIRSGIQRWQSSTCVSFREFQSPGAITNQSGLVITKGSGCLSNVGRVYLDRTQDVILGEGCVYPGIVSHEIGHALGFWHEHMRPDRDNYININFANMISGMESAFAKIAPEDDIDYGTGYDPTSVMHYDSLGFSVDYWGKKRVIVPKDVHLLTAIGQREYLSFNDVKRINLQYKCIENMCSGIKLSQPCQNGGYQDPNNCVKCRCPTGLGGDFCQDVASAIGSQSCGGKIEVPQCSSITLTSPGHPNYYAASSLCSWKLKSAGGLVFSFESQPAMPAKPSDTCLDYVDIITDMSRLAVPNGRFCLGGKSTGRVMIADKGEALVVFKSTSADQRGGGRSGFKLVVYSTCSGTTASGLSNECIITSSGYDYQGKQTNSDLGTCYAWAGQSYLGDLSFPDNNLQAAGCTCRNPDSRAYPWCYTGRSYSNVGYCKNIQSCPTSGAPPIQNNITTTAALSVITTPKTTVKCQNSEWNQCGGKGFKGPTCCPLGVMCVAQSEWYSQCQRSLSDFPEKIELSPDCRKTQAGRDYIGTVAVTKSGIPCQRWDAKLPQQHNYAAPEMFADKNITAAANYCRNPEKDYGGGVWCFTQNPFVRWEACDVPMCSAKRQSKIEEELTTDGAEQSYPGDFEYHGN